MRQLTLISILILVSCIAQEIMVQDTKQRRDPIFKVMREEITRAKERLQIEGEARPYFISYTLADIDNVNIEADLGALTGSSRKRSRPLTVEVRIGDYKIDNSKAEKERYAFDIDIGDVIAERMLERCCAPLDDDPDKLRHLLWLATDMKYKKAIYDYKKKKSALALKEEEDERPDDFSQERPTVSVGKVFRLKLDKKGWEEKIRGLSSHFKKYPGLVSGKVRFSAVVNNRYYLNTEGSRIRTGKRRFSLTLSASTKAKDGMELKLQRKFVAASVDQLPSESKITKQIEEMVKELEGLKEAKKIKFYKGPVLLEGEAACIFMLRVAGHPLEGDPKVFEKEGEFLDLVDQRIMTESITVYDDPTIERYNDTLLAGNYRFDGEGIPAQKVTLIERGTLKGFLLSRSPIKGFSKSNGHGRRKSWEWAKPCVGNLFVETSEGISRDELKKALIEECKRKNKPFGLLITSIEGEGEEVPRIIIIGCHGPSKKPTRQVIKLRPTLVYKVYAEDGREELVRGAEILVRSPVTLLDKIIATGNDPYVYNGTHEGQPVSVVSPSLLLSELVVKKVKKGKGSLPILPPPELR